MQLTPIADMSPFASHVILINIMRSIGGMTMEETIKPLLDHLQDICGLEAYKLKDWSIYHDAQSGYILSTEWLPGDLDEQDWKDENPAGAAVAEMNFHTKALKRLVFVQDVTYAKEGILPDAGKDQLLDWLEEQTGMMYGRQFQLAGETEREIRFQASIDHFPVAPSGHINVKFNESGQLTVFSIGGLFPEEEDMEWEPFALTFDDLEPSVRTLCTLVDVPVEKEEAWVPYYRIESVYVTNDGRTVVPEAAVNEHAAYLALDKILAWSGAGFGTVKKEKIDLGATVTLETAQLNAPHADRAPITGVLADQCLSEATRVMQLEHPDDSGKWRVVGIYRDHGYLIASIRPINWQRAVERKITILFDAEGNAINIVDNQFLFQLLGSFKAAVEPVFSKEEAYAMLKPHISADPVYVLNRDTGKYQVHAQIACPYAVNAVTGELVDIQKIL